MRGSMVAAVNDTHNASDECRGRQAQRAGSATAASSKLTRLQLSRCSSFRSRSRPISKSRLCAAV